MKILKVNYLVACTFLFMLLSGCSSGLDGIYSAEMGGARVEYHFESDGRVYVSGTSLFGDTGTTELNYEIDGDKLKIIAPNGKNQIFTIKDDGSIDAGMVTLRKNVSIDSKEPENNEVAQASSHSMPGQYLFGKWKVDTIDDKPIPNGEWFMFFSEGSMTSHVVSDKGNQKQEIIVKSYREDGDNVILAYDDGTEVTVKIINDDRMRYGDSNNMMELDRVN